MNEFTQQRWQQIDSLFSKALEYPLQQRLTFIQETCGADSDLLNHLEKLLLLHDEAKNIIGDSAKTFAAPLIPDLIDQITGEQYEKPGSSIGPYEIVEEIGRGGMGTVFLAKKTDAPYEVLVAIKLVRRGMDTHDVLRRFHHEGQILASLEHPNIARLYDGGVHHDGRPYFVMEYIKGEPIDVYCDKHHLPIEERLKLFITICDAVQHAHQNLIVHRDIKPAHVLVTPDGLVKLVDFGIAKLMAPDRIELNTFRTQTGVKIMTPEFASPEQVRGELITTASDIYSLGVLLYLLLTGRRPYRLETLSMLETERVVCEIDPLKPSEIVKGLSLPADGNAEEEPFDASKSPKLPGRDVRRLSRQLSGDLDRIVMKTLRKEPEHRYRSATTLADDLKNYLQGKPVQARPPTLRYRTRKFVHRHKWGVSTAAIAILVLTGGLVSTLWQASVAREERDIAQREAAKAQTVQNYLIELFEAADPAATQGEPISAQELVQRGVERLEEGLEAEPEIHIEMLKVLGRVKQALGDFKVSTELLDQALIKTRELRGETHPDVATVAAMLGEAARWNGELSKAETLLREALMLRRRIIRGDNPDVAINIDRLARVLEMQGNFEEAETLYREALLMRERLFGEDSDAVAANLNNLGWLLFEMGKSDDSEEALRRSLMIRERLIESPHPAIASTMTNLGVVLRSKGNYEEAELFFVQALEQERKLHGEDHPRYTTALSNLSVMHLNLARYEEAVKQYQLILENNRRQLGPTHLYVGIALGHLSTALTGAGRSAEALPLLDEALEVFRNAVGENHRFYARGLMIRGDALYYLNPNQAVIALEQSVDTYRRVVDHNHPDLARALTSLGRALIHTGELVSAETAIREALEIQREVLPLHHSDTAWTLTVLGRALTAQGHFEEAESILREAAEFSAVALPENHWRSIRARLELADCLIASGQVTTGRDEIEQVLALLHGRLDFHSMRLQSYALTLQERHTVAVGIEESTIPN